MNSPHTFRRTRVAALALAATLGSAGASDAQALGGGPFVVPEQNALYALHLTPRPERADLLAAGEFEFAFRTTYSNVFEYVRRENVEATLDYERWTQNVELVWSPSGDFEVGARAAIATGWGGFLDGLVQWYHQRLGLPNGDREDVPNGDFDVTLAPLGDTVLSLESGSFVMDPVVWAALPILRGRTALAARVSAKLPVGAEEWSGGGVDVAAQLDARHAWTRWVGYGGIAVTTLDASGPLERFTRRSAVAWHLGVERRLGEGWGLLGQFQGSTAYHRNLRNRELEIAPVNFGVGFVGELASGWRWQAAFTEDIRPDSPAVDFTLDLHLSRVFGGAGGPG
jgi:hypothetical protein